MKCEDCGKEVEERDWLPDLPICEPCMKGRKEKSIKAMAEYEEEKIQQLYEWWIERRKEKLKEDTVPTILEAYREGYKQAEMGTMMGTLLSNISGIGEQEEEEEC